MKYFVALIAMLAFGNSLLADNSIPFRSNTDANSPVGTWAFKTKDRKKYVRTFFENGTIKGDGFQGEGKWRVESDKIVISYPGKGEGWLALPLRPSGTKAMSHNGEQMTATRINQ